MLNIILITKKIKSKTIKRFIESKGIRDPLVLQNSDLLADTLLTIDSCNLYIFDFIFDLGVVNTVRDFIDKINYLHVFVSDTEAANAYTPLTDDVFIFPDLYDVMSWFWDSEVCRATNVIKFNNSDAEYCIVNEPEDTREVRSVSVKVRENTVHIPDLNEDAVQLILSCHFNGQETELVQQAVDDTEITEVFTDENKKIVSQSKAQVEIMPDDVEYSSVLADEKVEQKDMDIMAAKLLEDIKPSKQQPIVIEEAPQPVISKKPRRSLFGFKDKPAKSSKSKKSDASYVSFSNFASIKQEQVSSNETTNITDIDFSRHMIEKHYNTIAEYCLANKFISQEDHDALMKNLQYDRLISRDDQWARRALAANKITEEQLIQATKAVKNLGILTWEEVDALKPDLKTFGLDKCKKYRFFKLDDPDPLADRVTIVYSSSLAMLNPELYRMYDNPISKITLDVYIDRKLKEYE